MILSPQECTKRFGIGLTGSIATGKSTVAAHIRNAGYVVIDADVLAREAVAPGSEGLAAVRQRFGDSVINADGTLDRGGLRQILIEDTKARADLEGILHPEIQGLMHLRLGELGLLSQPTPWFYEAPLIYEKALDPRFHEIWTTHCSEKEQIARLCARDGMSEEKAREMIAIQMPSAEKARKASVVIHTEGPREGLREIVEAALQNLQAAAP